MKHFAVLAKIELPDHTAYLTDGNAITYDGDTYSPDDSLLGSLAGVSSLSESSGDIPAIDLQFHPPAPLLMADLADGALHSSEVRIWLVEVDYETGEADTATLLFSGQIDQPSVSIARGEYTLSLSVVPTLERLFERDTGNALSSAFHKSLYAGETGHDNASGLVYPVTWGLASVKVATTGTASIGAGNDGTFVGALA